MSFLKGIVKFLSKKVVKCPYCNHYVVREKLLQHKRKCKRKHKLQKKRDKLEKRKHHG